MLFSHSLLWHAATKMYFLKYFLYHPKLHLRIVFSFILSMFDCLWDFSLSCGTWVKTILWWTYYEGWHLKRSITFYYELPLKILFFFVTKRISLLYFYLTNVRIWYYFFLVFVWFCVRIWLRFLPVTLRFGTCIYFSSIVLFLMSLGACWCFIISVSSTRHH